MASSGAGIAATTAIDFGVMLGAIHPSRGYSPPNKTNNQSSDFFLYTAARVNLSNTMVLSSRGVSEMEGWNRRRNAMEAVVVVVSFGSSHHLFLITHKIFYQSGYKPPGIFDGAYTKSSSSGFYFKCIDPESSKSRRCAPSPGRPALGGTEFKNRSRPLDRAWTPNYKPTNDDGASFVLRIGRYFSR